LQAKSIGRKNCSAGTDLDVAHVTIAQLTGAIGTTLLPIVDKARAEERQYQRTATCRALSARRPPKA
jgi:hypothetical protein